MTSGLPDPRIDQELRTGPDRIIHPGGAAGILRARTIIIQGAAGGEFVYDGSGNLRIALVGQDTTDPIHGITCRAGISQFNAFGAVLLLISDTNDAIFGYQDKGTSAQGPLVFVLASAGGTDPVNGGGYGAGNTNIDPAFSDTINIIGATVKLNQPFNFTRAAQIGANAGAGATSPFIQVDAPEQTTGTHMQMKLQGTSPDGTHLGQALIGQVAGGGALTPVTDGMLEVQGQVASPGDSIVQVVTASGGLATDNSFGARVNGDSFNRLRINADGHLRWGTGAAVQDTDLLRIAVAILQLTSALEIVSAAAPAAGSNARLFATAGVLSGITPAGLAGGLPLVQGDHTGFTVTAITATALSKSWSIPANDANTDTTYRLTVWGNGTEGSTAQNLTWSIFLNGAATSQSATATALTLSGAFRWQVVILLHVATTGAGGNGSVNLAGVWATTASPAVENSFAAGSASATGQAFNTTVANTLALAVAWASATGAPTISSIGSTFERIGP